MPVLSAMSLVIRHRHCIEPQPVTPSIPRKAHYALIIALRAAGEPRLRKLQSGSYTQDTDENREYLQNQIPPMQNWETTSLLRG
jgi:hypothetical protein